MAAAISSVPANKEIGVKNNNDDLEINAMALKMKENFQKNVSTTRQQRITAPNAYQLPAEKPVSLNATAIPYPTASRVDSESVKGVFGWRKIAEYYIPYIIRVINDKHLKFVSVRMAESQLLTNYLSRLHTDIYSCISVQSYDITENEAKLLNEINQEHSDQIYGKDLFIASKDLIIHLEDLNEFYLFLEECNDKLLKITTPGHKVKCGFIYIDSESIVPYSITKDQKFLPLFYFEGDIDNLKHQAIKFENWDLAYLKFCFKVQGIREELFAGNSCHVISLDIIKSHYPYDTCFVDYWPNLEVDLLLETNQVNLQGCWVKKPCTVLIQVPKNIMQQSLLPPGQPAAALNMPMGFNLNQNQRSSYQMKSTVVLQHNIRNSNNQINIQPPLLVRNTDIPRIQMVSGSQIQLLQQQLQHQNQQKHMGTSAQALQQSRDGPPNMTTRGVISNDSPIFQQQNALWTTVTGPAFEIIDLTSPPSSPGPLSVPP